MGLVGDAVALTAFTSSIVTIGVANWGKTMNRDMLNVKNCTVSTTQTTVHHKDHLSHKYHSSHEE